MLVNFLIFFSCSVLVMTMYYSIVGDPGGGFLAALIFATAIPNSEVIYWKPGTMTIGMTMFSILALLFFIRHLRKGSNISFFACCAAYALSMICIEQGSLTIGVLVLYDLIFHSGPQFLSDKSERKRTANLFLRRHVILASLPVLLIVFKIVFDIGFSPIPWDSRDLSSIPWLAVETITKLIHLTNTILPRGSSPWAYRISAALILVILGAYIWKKKNLAGAFFLIVSITVVLTISIMAWGPHSRYYCLSLVYYACFLSLFLNNVIGDVVRHCTGNRSGMAADSDQTGNMSRNIHIAIYWSVCLTIVLAGLRGNLIRRDYWHAASVIERNAAETVEEYYRAGTMQDNPSQRIYLLNVPDFIWSEKYSFIYVSTNSLLLDIRHRIGGQAAGVIPIADSTPAEIIIWGKTMEYIKLGRDNVMDAASIKKLVEEGHVVLEFSPVTMTLSPFGINA